MNYHLVTILSQKSIHETTDSLAREFEGSGLGVFARIDHAANAVDAGLNLRSTELLIFGHPRGGTPLMQGLQTVGLDLPFKALIWEDENGRVWLTYDNPDDLVRRHGLGARSAHVITAIKEGMPKWRM